MIEQIEIPMGKVGQTPEGAWKNNVEYSFLATVLHDHDSWTSKKSGNLGHEPADNSEWWQRNTEGGKHAYDEGETAKEKGSTAERQGNTAQRQGNTAQEQGSAAELKGNAAATAAAYAALMAQNPPRVGKTLPNGDPDDNWWYYFVPNQDFTGGTYVKTDVYAKGDSLDWDSMTEADKELVIQQAAEKALEEMVVENVSDETITGWIDNA